MAYNIPTGLRTQILAGEGPYGGIFVVDKGSTETIEDGSWKYPFKTIQGALDAMPMPATFSTTRRIMIIQGLYDEHLTVSVDAGAVIIQPVGYVILANEVFAARHVTVTLESAGGVGADRNTFQIGGGGSGVFLSAGNITLSDGGSGYEADVLLEYVQCNTVALNGTGAVSLEVYEASLGTLTLNAGSAILKDTRVSNQLTLPVLSKAVLCEFGDVDVGDVTFGVYDTRITGEWDGTDLKCDLTTLYTSLSDGLTVAPGHSFSAIEIGDVPYVDGTVALLASTFAPVSGTWTLVESGAFVAYARTPEDGGALLTAPVPIDNRANVDRGNRALSFTVFYTVSTADVAVDITAELRTFDGSGATPAATGSNPAGSYNENQATRIQQGNHKVTYTFDAPLTLAVPGGWFIYFRVNDSGGGSADVTFKGGYVTFDNLVNDFTWMDVS